MKLPNILKWFRDRCEYEDTRRVFAADLAAIQKLDQTPEPKPAKEQQP